MELKIKICASSSFLPTPFFKQKVTLVMTLSDDFVETRGEDLEGTRRDKLTKEDSESDGSQKVYVVVKKSDEFTKRRLSSSDSEGKE